MSTSPSPLIFGYAKEVPRVLHRFISLAHSSAKCQGSACPSSRLRGQDFGIFFFLDLFNESFSQSVQYFDLRIINLEIWNFALPSLLFFQGAHAGFSLPVVTAGYFDTESLAGRMRPQGLRDLWRLKTLEQLQKYIPSI